MPEAALGLTTWKLATLMLRLKPAGIGPTLAVASVLPGVSTAVGSAIHVEVVVEAAAVRQSRLPRVGTSCKASASPFISPPAAAIDAEVIVIAAAVRQSRLPKVGVF